MRNLGSRIIVVCLLIAIILLAINVFLQYKSKEEHKDFIERFNRIVANQDLIRQAIVAITPDVQTNKALIANNTQTLNSLIAAVNEHTSTTNQICGGSKINTVKIKSLQQEYVILNQKVDLLIQSVKDKNSHIEQMDKRLQIMSDYMIKGWQAPKP